MNKLDGCYVAGLTPFKADQALDFDLHQRLLKFNIQEGFDGVYLNGSTGEFPFLSIEERKQLLENAVDAIGEKGKILCHVGAIGTLPSIELAQHAQEHGADAISSIPPFYFQYQKMEVMDYFSRLADSVDIPVILYNFPKLSGFDITPDDVRKLQEKHQNIVGIKFTSKELDKIPEFRTVSDDFMIFNGFDELFSAGHIMGATGAIGSTYNIMGEKFIQLKKRLNLGDMNGSSELQSEICNVINQLLSFPFMPALKHIMSLKGVDCGRCREPFRELDTDEKQRLHQLFADCIGN
ncbi:MAG: dihydrodipicolinate synthase family protein [Spirochaetales bacterium]|nr:dihydrodipicolinate synthase family protein [Spirochaetales bacterium]